VARGKDRGDRVAKDDEDRKRSEEGPRAGSSRRRQRDEHDDHLQRHHDEPVRVPKKREEAHVERIPLKEGQTPEDIEVRDDETLIPLTEEEGGDYWTPLLRANRRPFPDRSPPTTLGCARIHPCWRV